MDNRLVLTTILLLVLVLILATADPATAQMDNACVVVVIDESGSMADNDPSYLRNTGAKLLISVLDEEDRAGIIRFSSGARALTPELVTLGHPEEKDLLLGLLQDAPPDGYTDMKAALAEAGRLLQGATCGNRTIVLLSDGYPQLESGLPSTYPAETVALVEELNVPVYAIALTAEGESGLLYQLAAATDPAGIVIPARTASDLLDAYLDVIAHLKDRTVVGSGYTAAPGTAPLPLEPGLAQYVSRVTYIVSKPAGVTARPLAPGGNPVQPDDPRVVFAYTGDPRFAAYTIANPAPGAWAWAMEGNGQVQARAILRSRLRIVAEQPAAFHPQGEPLPLAVRLIEEEADGTVTTLIGQTSFSAFITRPDGSQDELDRLYDDGGSTAGVASGDSRAGDGVFANRYVKTDIPGAYTIAVTGYKGVIPTTRRLRVQVVPFPRPQIVAPAGGSVELRGESLPLEVKLAGGEPPDLDTGTFNAVIAGPGGTTEVPLAAREDGGWHGTFTPTANGLYTIRFEPQGATYKGAPYTLAAETSVEVVLVPAVRLTLAQEDLGAVAVGEAGGGLTLVVQAVSSSDQAESVNFSVAGIPGLTVQKVTPAELPPGESTVHVTVAGAPAPGNHDGALVASVREGVDLDEPELPLRLEIYRPALLVETASLEMAVRVDQLPGGAEGAITVSSNSRREESVSLLWQGADGVRVEAGRVKVPAGERVELPFTLSGELPEGEYKGRLRLAAGDGVAVTPEVVSVSLAVVPVPWCARWCLPLGAIGAVALGTLIVVRNRLRRRPRPHGSLKPVTVPAGQSVPSVLPLSARGSRITIGSRSTDILLTGGDVRSKHAAIRAEMQTVMERVGHPPQLVEMEKPVNVVKNLSDGLVRVGSVPIIQGQVSAPLQNGTRIAIGEYEFVYRA